MHEIAGFELDIDNDFPAPTPEDKNTKPEHLGYENVLSNYRYCGRNLLDMIASAGEMEASEVKTMYINFIASFMINSSKNWNDEDLTPLQIVQHLADLSNGKLQVAPASLDIHLLDAIYRTDKFNWSRFLDYRFDNSLIDSTTKYKASKLEAFFVYNGEFGVYEIIILR